MSHNILNYTILELMKILSIDDIDELNRDTIIINTQKLINKAVEENNFSLRRFYEEVQNKLLEFVETFDSEEEKEEGEGEEEKEEGKEIDEYYNSEIKEGDINPLINKTEKKFLVLDSQFLPENVDKTNYVVNLSEKIKRVINIKLHSYSIPFNWYLISSQKRNNKFYLLNNNSEKINIIINDGNYTTQQLVSEINLKIKVKLSISNDTVSYNENTGKIKIDLYQQIQEIVFFDKDQPYLLEGEGEEQEIDDILFSSLRSYKNLTLGWILGFRKDKIIPTINGNISDVIPDMKGPRYLYLVFDDYKRNHTTNNMISITKIDDNIIMPSYYNHHMPLDCRQETLTVLPSAPRRLTRSQIYTINEVMKHKNRTNYYSTSPVESDILAIIPLKHNGLSIGDRIVESSGQLQDNRRDYNGPVDLDRIGIKLIDDNGFIIDLNGSDWTVSFLYEYIYQM